MKRERKGFFIRQTPLRQSNKEEKVKEKVLKRYNKDRVKRKKKRKKFKTEELPIQSNYEERKKRFL